jgi:rod shape-determining protein MreB and related proteins
MNWLNIKWRRAGKLLTRRDIYVDLGTENTLIYIQGKGLVLNEPSFVSYRTNEYGRTPIAYGAEAKRMMGKTPDNIEIVRPLKDGVIADFDAALHMLRKFINIVNSTSKALMNGRLVISLPCKVSGFEKRAVMDVGRALGVKSTHLVDEPVLAALGADLPITAPVGSMVVDIGGGTTEIAVMTLGGLAYANALRVGGHEMDQRIVEHFKSQFNFLIGEPTAEYLKVHYAHAILDVPEMMDVKGLDLTSNLPKILNVKQEEIRKAIEPALRSIVSAIQTALREIDPELSADLGDKGIHMAGGVAQIPGFADRIAKETGVKVILSDEPLTSIARGGAKVLESPQLLALLTNF